MKYASYSLLLFWKNAQQITTATKLNYPFGTSTSQHSHTALYQTRLKARDINTKKSFVYFSVRAKVSLPFRKSLAPMPSNCDSTASFFSSPFLTSFQLSILQVSMKSLSHIWVETMLKQNKWNRSKLTSEWAESKQQLSAGFWKLLNSSAELRGFTSYTQTRTLLLV